MARVAFEDNSFSEAERAANSEWRPLTDYERSLLDLLLTPEFLGREALRREAETVRCRAIDRCGCIEFNRGALIEERSGERIVSEARGPRTTKLVVDLMLSARGDHLLWLEFYRLGTDTSFFPPAKAFECLVPDGP